MTTEDKPSIVKISGEISNMAVSSGIEDEKVSDKFFDMIESTEDSLKIIKKSITENGDGKEN